LECWPGRAWPTVLWCRRKVSESHVFLHATQTGNWGCDAPEPKATAQMQLSAAPAAFHFWPCILCLQKLIWLSYMNHYLIKKEHNIHIILFIYLPIHINIINYVKKWRICSRVRRSEHGLILPADGVVDGGVGGVDLFAVAQHRPTEIVRSSSQIREIGPQCRLNISNTL